MLKRSFFCLSKPRFEYAKVEQTPVGSEKVTLPKKVTLFLKSPYKNNGSASLKIGDTVKTGQKIKLFEDSEAYVVSSVTGSVSSISSYVGDYGQLYTSIKIDVAKEEVFDDAFSAVADSPSVDAIKDFLADSPGLPAVEAFLNPEKPIKTLVICGADEDLLVTTNQYVMKSNPEYIDTAIRMLKKITGVSHIVVALPGNIMREAGGVGGASGAELRTIDDVYPDALPQMVMQKIVGKVLPAGQTPEDMGVCILNAQAAASIGKAFSTGKLPTSKTVTLIKKDLSKVMVEATIGAPIGDIFKAYDVTLGEKDRVIIGGPMRGAAVFSEEHPVQPDTDAIMVQDSADIPMVEDVVCINCGECVRICPTNVPVNMLVRFCAAGNYESAVDEYDLYSCIDCGLCSFVCVARIPIFQYIRLAKYELARLTEAEATDE